PARAARRGGLRAAGRRGSGRPGTGRTRRRRRGRTRTARRAALAAAAGGRGAGGRPGRAMKRRLRLYWTEWSIALHFLREGRLQTLMILAGVAVGVAVIVFITALIQGLQ